MGNLLQGSCLHNGRYDNEDYTVTKSKSFSKENTESKQRVQSKDLTPESFAQGYGSQFERSSRNSFYEENQIGPYLHVDQGTSYQGKMKKWKKLLNQTPIATNSTVSTKNTKKSIIFQTTTTCWDQSNKMKSSDLIQDQQDQQYQDYGCVSPPSNYKNSLDTHIIQKTFPFVSNELDSAIVCYNIMDNLGFKQLLLEGPPDMRLRWSCWKTALLKKTQWEKLETKLQNTAIENEELIMKDIKRTITWHQFYQSEQMQQSVGHVSLSKILKALVNTYPKLGYCQGMNFLAGLIINQLKGFILLVSGGDEFQSYTFLAELMKSPKYMLYFAYKSELPFLMFLEQFILSQIRVHHFKIHNHIIQIELPNSFWLTKIILSLFLYSFKINVCLRFWDFLMATNIFGLVSIVLAIVDVYGEQILKMNMNDFMEWFSNFSDKDIDHKNIIYLAQSKYKISKVDVANFAKKLKKPNLFVSNLQHYDEPKKFKISYQKMIQ